MSENIEYDFIEDYWLNQLDFSKYEMNNPLDIPPSLKDRPEEYILWKITQPEYLHLFVKYVFNIELYPLQVVILRELWKRKFPMLIGSRGFGKSFLLGLYSALRVTLLRNRKVVIAGAGFRQSKVIFEYMDKIWNNAPVWRSLAKSLWKKSGSQRHPDMWKYKIGDSEAIFIPIGDGNKIRGQRANDLITDEFNSINENIFEVSLAGFTMVSAEPVEKMKMAFRRKAAEKLGVELEESNNKLSLDNQLVISGTPGYTFQHYYKYYTKWKDIILGQENSEDVNPEHYSITRIPWNIIPDGFMDRDQILRSKATMNKGNYLSELGACFSDDSDGFFRRKLLEKATVSPQRIDEIQSIREGADVFEARFIGSRKLTYVYGVDTASEADNFAVVILEEHRDHRRIVYSWATNKEKHRKLLAQKTISEDNFFNYCHRHIRNLMKRFPCRAIAIDEQGGGYQLIEAFHSEVNMEEGEQKIWPVQDYKRDNLGKNKAGLHIIHPITPSNAVWVSTANHGMKKDLEELILLFPYLDSVTLSNASYMGEQLQEESLEDIMLDIEDLKDEMASIIHKMSPSGNREQWNTPEVKRPDGTKGRQRKDRYSALLMANAVARANEENNPFLSVDYSTMGWAKKMKEEKGDGTLYGKDTAYQLPANIYDVQP